MGEDRLIDIFEKYVNQEEVKINTPDLYIAYIGEACEKTALNLALQLRKNGKYIETDICKRSMKASLKYADKMNCKYVIVIGEDELKENRTKIKNMETGKEEIIELNIEKII